jgi:4-hydroxybenzoate polyprenyltransferase
MCTPAFAALLWLGTFPALHVVILGLITTFAGYTAVYALNDVIDFKADKEKAAQGVFSDSGGDLDGMLVRHPMAHGLLSLKEGLLWALAWGFLALIGAYILNPVCVLIFLGGCMLEAIYCLLWRVSPFRTFVSGAVKTSGALAAVFAVDPQPAFQYLVVLFLLLFFWEIGGQNVPNDWVDCEEDRRMKAKTIPVKWGLQPANIIILTTIMLTLAMNILIFNVSQVHFGIIWVILSLAAGCYLLLIPALRLSRTKARSDALVLFNKASYYPLTLMVIVVAKLLIL